MVKFKDKMRMKITKVGKMKDENDKEILVVKNSNWIDVRGKDFRTSINDRNSKQIEICSTAPARFQLNIVYVRADGKVAWTYILEDERNE